MTLLEFIFLLLAILGITSTILFYLIGKKTKRAVFLIKSTKLFENNSSMFREQMLLSKFKHIVHSLTKTKFAFYNDGNVTINKEDIASTNKLRITGKERNIYILEYNIEYIKNEANNFEIKLDEEKNNIYVNFGYIDKGEGIILNIYHTGNLTDELELKGAINGTKIINKLMSKGQLKVQIQCVLVFCILFLPSVWALCLSVKEHSTYIYYILTTLGISLIINLFIVIIGMSRLKRWFPLKMSVESKFYE